MGFEIAKNIILTGPKAVTLYDPTLVKINDVGTNFYINESQVGKVSRAQACSTQLKELNPYIEIDVLPAEPTNELLKTYSVIFVTELLLPIKRIKEIDAFCRASNPAIGFIFTMAMGLYGFTFVDFGQKFVVKDANGENVSSFVVALITQGNPGIVRIHEEKRHNFNDGDYVKFREVEGMPELNAMPGVQIKVIDKHSFSICDTSKFKDCTK